MSHSSTLEKQAIVIGIFLSIAALIASGCGSSPKRVKEVSSEEKTQLLNEIAAASIVGNDPIGALQVLKQAEELDTKNPQTPYLKAIALMMRKDLLAAAESAKRATELKDDFSDAYNLLGKLYIDSGQLALAEAPLKKAANDTLYREAFKAHTNLGILYYRVGKFDLAQKHFDESVSQNPEFSCISYYYRGHLQLRNNQFKEAIKEYDLATRKICANFVDAHLALAIAYERSKDFSRARKKLLDISQAFPNTQASEQALDRLKNLP